MLLLVCVVFRFEMIVPVRLDDIMVGLKFSVFIVPFIA